jgi:hypothetical protein
MASWFSVGTKIVFMLIIASHQLASDRNDDLGERFLRTPTPFGVS